MPQPAQSPPCCTKIVTAHQRLVYQLRIIRCSTIIALESGLTLHSITSAIFNYSFSINRSVKSQFSKKKIGISTNTALVQNEVN